MQEKQRWDKQVWGGIQSLRVIFKHNKERRDIDVEETEKISIQCRPGIGWWDQAGSLKFLGRFKGVGTAISAIVQSVLYHVGLDYLSVMSVLQFSLSILTNNSISCTLRMAKTILCYLVESITLWEHKAMLESVSFSAAAVLLQQLTLYWMKLCLYFMSRFNIAVFEARPLKPFIQGKKKHESTQQNKIGSTMWINLRIMQIRYGKFQGDSAQCCW